MASAADEQRVRMMRAVVRDRYGSPDVLEIRKVPKPELTDDGVLVRVRATSLNRSDWYSLVGAPYIARPRMGGLRKPKTEFLGGDFAGVVEAVGKSVPDLRPGDEVFGGRRGAFAEYVVAHEAVARKPANLAFEEAAAIPVAGITALQAIRDHGKLEPGQKVLVNGASGGVGTFAVQIAKAFGGEVTGVCSPRNVDLVRSLGADEVVDYTVEDFTRRNERYDVLLDVAGGKSWSACRRVLAEDARVVIIGGPLGSHLLGPLAHIARIRLGSLRGGQRAGFFLAKLGQADLAVVRELVEGGKVTPVVEKRYELSEIADAFRHLGEGHARGKLVVTI